MHQRTALLLGCLGFAACAGPTGFDYRGVTASAPLSDSFRTWRPDGPRHALSRMPAGVMLASAECVPFARAVSGVDIVGDAWTWWEQAQGRYRRGRAPEVGAVMVFRATEEMPLGHVAVVTAVLGPRAVLVSHQLWRLFDALDVIITPMLSGPPPPLGHFATNHGEVDEHFEKMTAFAPLAALANVSGFPALALPFGADALGLPLPVQMIAPFGAEKLLLALAARLESEQRWSHRFPVAGLS